VRKGVVAFIILSTLFLLVFAFYYVKYQRIIDQRMNGPIFSYSALIYARPKAVHVGQTISAQEVISELRRAGYSEDGEKSDSPIGTYRSLGNGVEIRPGSQSYHSPETAQVWFSGSRVSRINAGGGGTISAYELEPQLLTS
jgi:penicillin-binding protein 1B